MRPIRGTDGRSTSPHARSPQPELLEEADRYRDADLFGRALILPDGSTDFRPSSTVVLHSLRWAWRGRPPEGDCCVISIMCAVMLVRMDAFRRIGGVEDNIFLYFEDTDFCQRLAMSGSRSVDVPTARDHHGSGRSSAPSWQSLWHVAWSHAYVCAKFGMPNPARRQLFFELVRIPKAVLRLNRTKLVSFCGAARRVCVSEGAFSDQLRRRFEQAVTDGDTSNAQRTR